MPTAESTKVTGLYIFNRIRLIIEQINLRNHLTSLLRSATYAQYCRQYIFLLYYDSKINSVYLTLNILLADDDIDDCLFFKDAVEELKLPVQLTTVHDGEELMHHLWSAANLPHAIFLDLNLPRKSGSECLTEIKNTPTLKQIPVVIFSTSYDPEKANLLYDTGAHYYIRKPSDFEEMKVVLNRAITLLSKNNLQATRENFYINKLKTAF